MLDAFAQDDRTMFAGFIHMKRDFPSLRTYPSVSSSSFPEFHRAGWSTFSGDFSGTFQIPELISES